jgi:hypothetical protein
MITTKAAANAKGLPVAFVTLFENASNFLNSSLFMVNAILVLMKLLFYFDK